MGQDDVLRLLKKHGGRLTNIEIAKELNIGESSICINTRKLKKAGLVTRKIKEGTLRQFEYRFKKT